MNVWLDCWVIACCCVHMHAMYGGGNVWRESFCYITREQLNIYVYRVCKYVLSADAIRMCFCMCVAVENRTYWTTAGLSSCCALYITQTTFHSIYMELWDASKHNNFLVRKSGKLFSLRFSRTHFRARQANHPFFFFSVCFNISRVCVFGGEYIFCLDTIASKLCSARFQQMNISNGIEGRKHELTHTAEWQAGGMRGDILITYVL